jgi:Uracil DNA glycosylase
MTIEEYFGDWMKVIDKAEAMKIMGWLKTLNPNTLCPALPNVFRAFKLCPYNKCRVVFIGQDPYPQKGVATGVLFGNSKDTPEDKLSPSLQVVKESVIDYGVYHNLYTFDNTLESWAKQGILMINSALTCRVNAVGSHVNEWRPFVSKLVKNLSTRETGIIYVLFGRQAQTLKPYIDERYNDIIEIEHPAFFARTNQIMPHSVFAEVNNLLYGRYGEKIEWYKEEIYNTDENEK